MKLPLVVALISFALCGNALAGDQAGKVKELTVRSDNLHFFFLEGTHSNKPGCATADYWMIKDENSVGGKGQLSMLLAAQAQDKIVYVNGTGTCTRWANGEDVYAITTKP